MTDAAAADPGGLPGWTEVELACRIEEARRALSCIRYGSVFRLGAATVVLNPDSPLVGDNLAAGFAGTPAAAEATLALLPDVFAEAGRQEAAVLGSPSSVPELAMVAEEGGYDAVDEGQEMVLADPGALVAGEPGNLVRPVRGHDDWQLGPLLADALDLPRGAEHSLGKVLGHRLDDPRVSAFAAYADGLSGGGDVVGLALGFADREVGLVAEVAVRPDRRRRGLGRALASAAAMSLMAEGARPVVAASPLGGHLERFWGSLGFAPAYETSLYARRLEIGGQPGHSTPNLEDGFDEVLARDTQKGDHG